MTTAPLDRSYRALLRVPTLGRVLVSMQIARVAQSMVSVAIVLFTLDRYGSAAFAGSDHLRRWPSAYDGRDPPASSSRSRAVRT